MGSSSVAPQAISCEYFLLNSPWIFAMSPLTVAEKVPRFWRLSWGAYVVVTVLMVASLMMTLYIKGVYSTPSKVYLL